MFTLSQCLNKKLTYTDNKFGIKGVIAEQNIKKGDTITSFPLNVLVYSDMNIYQRLIQKLKGVVNNTAILQFCLALNILYHPKKYKHIHQYIIENYTPHKPFLFKEKYMAMMKDTISYYLIHGEKLNFDLMLNTYRHIESDITSQMETRLRVIYGFCHANSHGISMDSGSIRCLNPAFIINHKNHTTTPLLEHTIEDNVWTVKAERDYYRGEEILDCYCSINTVIHPYYPDLYLKDWKLSMSVHYGSMINLTKNTNEDTGFKLSDGVNEQKIKLLDKLYANIDLKSLDTNDPYQKVVHYLLSTELEYYTSFRKGLEQKLVINENINQTVDMVIE